MHIELIPAAESQKSVLRQLMELYNHDFSEYTHDDVDEHGYFGYTYLDHYWTDDTRHPFFIKVDGNLAGFVLVRQHCEYTTNEHAHDIAEFFVMRRYRGLGVGRKVAALTFNAFPGEWEVRVYHSNKPAFPFWRKVIDGYTGGKFTYHPDPTEDWNGVGYTFISEAT